MDSMDISVLAALHDWRGSNLPLWLVTVVETFGSSPRPKGAMLVLRGDGLAVGSVSGGCIEDDLIRRATQGELSSDACEVLSYGVTRDDARRFGLPCGGTMRLVVEPIREVDWVERALHSVQAHQLTKRTLHFASGQVVLADACRTDFITFDGETLTTLHGPHWRLLIIGAGQVAGYLAHMAQALDYEVVVCEPRREIRQTWDVPGTLLTSEMPDDAVLALEVDPCTAIVALTHDPKLDDMALLEALKSPAFYVGALGSNANNAKRRERLALFDLSPEEIGRLHGPVGLPIGSRTPPEIAVSILAQLVSIRNQTPALAGATLSPTQEVCS